MPPNILQNNKNPVNPVSHAMAELIGDAEVLYPGKYRLYCLRLILLALFWQGVTVVLKTSFPGSQAALSSLGWLGCNYASE